MPTALDCHHAVVNETISGYGSIQMKAWQHHLLGDKRGITYECSGIANALCADGKCVKVARFQGCEAGLFEQIGVKLEPRDKSAFY